MIELTAQPEKFSSVYRPVIYTLTKIGTEKETVQILNGSAVLGMKQFVTAGGIAVNVSEYYRNLIETAPVIDDSLSFVHAVKRTVTARIDVTADSSVLLTSGITDLALSTLLSNATGPRVLRPGEWDELSYLVDEKVLTGSVVMGMNDGTNTTIQIPNSSIDGIAVLVVHYDSISEALGLLGKSMSNVRTITVKPILGGYNLPEVSYVIAHKVDGVRIAWWNRKGGIDYFTFKANLNKSYTTERTKVKTSNGWATVSSEVEDEMNVASELLPPSTMEWLSEIVSSPKVWLVDGASALPIDITSDSITTYDLDKLQQLELTFRSIDTEKMQTT